MAKMDSDIVGWITRGGKRRSGLKKNANRLGRKKVKR